MNDKPKCCFCGRETTVQGQRPHQEHCLYGPMGQRVKDFCRQYIDAHGRITTREWEKNQERRDLGLPSEMHIIRTLGSWPAFIAWCGIKYKRLHLKKITHDLTDEENMQRIDDMLAQGRAALGSAYDYDFCAIDRGIKRLYDWRTMTYYEAHVMELR